MLAGYRILEYDLMEIKVLIEQKQKYDASLQNEFKKAMQREKTLIGKTPETREKIKIKDLCEAEVVQELPRESFFVPEE
nr:J28 [uncultured bacterium]